MKKKHILFLLGIIVILIFIVIVGFKAINNLKKDKVQSQEQSETIKTSYEKFNKLATNFNEENKEYLLKIKEVYFTTLEKEEKNLKEQLNNLKTIIHEMKSEEERVKEICKINFTDKETNQYCETIKVSVKTATDVYNNEIVEYNDLIEKYNIWQEENSKYKKLETYKEGE